MIKKKTALKHPFNNSNLLIYILKFCCEGNDQVSIKEFVKVNKMFKQVIDKNMLIIETIVTPSNQGNYMQEIPFFKLLKEHKLNFDYVRRIECYLSLYNGELMVCNLYKKKVPQTLSSKSIEHLKLKEDDMKIYIKSVMNSRILIDEVKKLDKKGYLFDISKKKDLILFRAIAKFKNIWAEFNKNIYLTQMNFKIYYCRFQLE